jgi:hypothetical protein
MPKCERGDNPEDEFFYRMWMRLLGGLQRGPARDVKPQPLRSLK